MFSVKLVSHKKIIPSVKKKKEKQIIDESQTNECEKGHERKGTLVFEEIFASASI